MRHAVDNPPAKKKTGKIIVIVVLVVFVVGFCFGAFMMLKTMLTAKKEQETFDSLQEMVEDTADEVDEETGALRCYDALYEKNKDFFGWLKIDDSKIDYPVMYSPEEPERYLHSDFYGNYSESGMLFIDGECPYDSNYYLIYGHHMRNGSMFGELPEYRSFDYYEKHKTVYFDTRFERRDYEVFAAFYAEVYDIRDEEGKFCYYNYKNLSSKAAFDEYIANVKALSVYDTGITPQFGDDIIALSTCNYHTEDGRFVVVARMNKKDLKSPTEEMPTSDATAKSE